MIEAFNQAQSRAQQFGDLERELAGNSSATQASIPRAMAAQAAAGKRLNSVAHELLKRLQPLLMPEAPQNDVGAGGAGPVNAPCALSSQIDRSTSDITMAANLLTAILRRLAL